MEAFKKKVKKDTGFKGRPIFNNKYTKSYIKYAKSNDDHISLPNDILYKGKFVKKETLIDNRKKDGSFKKSVNNYFKKRNETPEFSITTKENKKFSTKENTLTFKNKKIYSDDKVRKAVIKEVKKLEAQGKQVRIIFGKESTGLGDPYKAFSTSLMKNINEENLKEVQDKSNPASTIQNGNLHQTTITIQVASNPSGGKLMKAPKWLENTNALCIIENDDELCGQRCITMFQADSKKRRNLKSRKKQFDKETESICKMIKHTTRMYMTDFDKLNEFGIRTIVFSSKSAIIHDSESHLEEDKKQTKKIMYLYYDIFEEHYHLIININKFSENSKNKNCKWCDKCQKAIDGRCYSFHQCIEKKCTLCGEYDCDDTKKEWKNCECCNKFCINDTCLKNHTKNFHTYKKSNKTRRVGSIKKSKVWFCKCKNIVEMERYESGKHICYEKNCGNCNEYYGKNEEHNCNIQCREITEKSLGESHTYYCFDFESMFDENNYHKVNLVKVGKMYDDKFMKTFNNIEDFISWSIEQKNSTFIAHNLKGYDGWLIHHNLKINFGKTPDKIILAGQKVMYMEFGRTRFIDSLNFVMAPLSSLPKTFGLDTSIVKKGYFPYMFNTIENQNYKGSFPSIDFFEPNKMKCRKDFDIWYEENKNNEYDFNNDLNEYCENDVVVLCKSLEVFRDSMKKLCNGLDPLQCITIASFCMKVYLSIHAPSEEELEEKDEIFRDKKQTAISILNKNQYTTIKKGFGGGRTEVFKLYKKWTDDSGELKKKGVYGKYVDIVSLYPTCQFLDYLPYGKPQHFTEINDTDISKYFGFVRCDITPPKDLHIPLLGGKQVVNGETKFCFGLNEMKDVVYSTEELKKAVSIGYVIDKVYEVFHFKKSKGLFKSYIRSFMKGKICGGGYEGTYQEKAKYCKEYKNKFGIEIKPEELIKNSGIKAVSKLCLNSLWGKFAMRQMKTTKYYNNSSEWFKLLKRSEIGEVIIHSKKDLGESLFIEFEETKEEKTSLSSTNIALASMVTSQARLRLYEEMEKLKERVIYCDTDSIIYEYDESKYNTKTGKMLGDWEAEGKEDHIMTEFIGIAPKAYSYKLMDGKKDLKSKGVSMTEENKEIITFESYKDLVDKTLTNTDKENKPKIKSNMLDFNKSINGIQTIHTYKDISFNNEGFKRNIQNDYSTRPFGFVC